MRRGTGERLKKNQRKQDRNGWLKVANDSWHECNAPTGAVARSQLAVCRRNATQMEEGNAATQIDVR